MRYILAALVFLAASFYIGTNGARWHENYLMNKLSPSVVKLTPVNNPLSGGTGFQVMTVNGPRIMTNSHVCDVFGKYALATAPAGQQVVQVLYHDATADLCLLTAFIGLPALELAGSGPETGDELAVLGHPQLSPQTFAKGRVLGKQVVKVMTGFASQACIDDPLSEVIFVFCVKSYVSTLTNIKIYPGNSGSPVVNIWGKVTNVVFASDNQMHHGVLVPYEDVKRVLESEL